MNNQYIIVNKTAILETIEELKASLNFIPESYISKHLAQIYAFEQILLKSTPLIPEIESAFDAGREWGYDTATNSDVDSKTFDNLEEYISNLKLDI